MLAFLNVAINSKILSIASGGEAVSPPLNY